MPLLKEMLEGPAYDCMEAFIKLLCSWSGPSVYISVDIWILLLGVYEFEDEVCILKQKSVSAFHPEHLNSKPFQMSFEKVRG